MQDLCTMETEEKNGKEENLDHGMYGSEARKEIVRPLF